MGRVTRAPAEPSGRLGVEWHPASQLPLVSTAPRQGLGRRRLLRGLHLGAGGKGEVQTPNAISSSQGKTRAPGRLCVESADPWGCRPLLVSPRHPCASRLVREAQTTQLGELWGQGACATRLPCTSPDARQSGCSEESCQVKGRNAQRPGLGPHPLRPQRWFPCSGAGWSLCHHSPAPGPHVVQGPLGV